MFGMSQSDRDLLLEVHQDQKWIIQEFAKFREEATSEDGYKRCVAHKEQMKALKDDQEDIKKSYRWIRNTFVGTLTTAALGALAAGFNFVMGK